MDNLNTRIKAAEKQINISVKKDKRLIVAIFIDGLCSIDYSDDLKFSGNMAELEAWQKLNRIGEDEILIINVIAAE